METHFYLRYAGFVDILCFLTFSFSFRDTSWPVLADVVLFDEQVEVDFEAGTIHGDFVTAAFLHTFVFIRYESVDRLIFGVLHFVEGGLDNASGDRLVGLPQAFEE